MPLSFSSSLMMDIFVSHVLWHECKRRGNPSLLSSFSCLMMSALVVSNCILYLRYCNMLCSLLLLPDDDSNVNSSYFLNFQVIFMVARHESVKSWIIICRCLSLPPRCEIRKCVKCIREGEVTGTFANATRNPGQK